MIGFISIFSSDCEEEPNLTPWYATMYVKKIYRKQGYSKILNDAILKEAKERGFEYLSAQNQEELDQVLSAFNDPNINQTKPMFLEVFTDTDKDVADYKSYYHSLKNK